MKKEKQARRQNSGSAVGKQQAKPGDFGGVNLDAFTANFHRAITEMIAEIDGAIQAPLSTQERIRLLMLRQCAEDIQCEAVVLTTLAASNTAPVAAPEWVKCCEGIDGAISQINDNIAEAETDSEKIMLLAIRQYLSPLVDIVKPMVPPAPPQPAPEPRPFSTGPKTMPDFKPFGRSEPPGDTDLARMEIIEGWRECGPMEFHDGVESLFKFCHCIQNAEHLQMEATAIDYFGHVTNVLGQLRYKDRSKMTVAERWLADRRSEKPKATFTETVEMLSQAEPLLRENAASVELADTIATMNRWINVLVAVEEYVDTI